MLNIAVFATIVWFAELLFIFAGYHPNNCFPRESSNINTCLTISERISLGNASSSSHTTNENNEMPPSYSSVTEANQNTNTNIHIPDASSLTLDPDGSTYQTLKIFSVTAASNNNQTPSNHSSILSRQPETHTSNYLSTGTSSDSQSLGIFKSNHPTSDTSRLASAPLVDKEINEILPSYSSVTANQETGSQSITADYDIPPTINDEIAVTVDDVVITEDDVKPPLYVAEF